MTKRKENKKDQRTWLDGFIAGWGRIFEDSTIYDEYGIPITGDRLTREEEKEQNEEVGFWSRLFFGTKKEENKNKQ